MFIIVALLLFFAQTRANDFEAAEAPEILIPRKSCFCTFFGSEDDPANELSCIPGTHDCECKVLDFGHAGNRCFCFAITWGVQGVTSVGCDGNKCCKYSRRRELMSSSLMQFEGDSADETEELSKLMETCGAFEYTGLLHVDSHLRALATPGEEAVSAGCPFFMTQATFAGQASSTKGSKTMYIWYDNEGGEEDDDSPYKDESLYLPVGTFQLSKLLNAYKEADANSGVSSTKYNVVTNNCGSFMVNLGRLLGIKIDGKVTSFVARRLLEESGKELGSRIRDSISNFSLLPGWSNGNRQLHAKADGTAYTDQELVETLVDAQASVLY